MLVVGVHAGLDDGDQNSNDPVTVHGSFLSFLHLRHLRIRDLQRTVSLCSAWPAAYTLLNACALLVCSVIMHVCSVIVVVCSVIVLVCSVIVPVIVLVCSVIKIMLGAL